MVLDIYARNDRSRTALGKVIGRLGPNDLSEMVDDTWRVSAVLGHLAVWDRYLEFRWRQARDQGLLMPVLDVTLTTEVLNDALAPLLDGIGSILAGQLTLSAAESIDTFVASLPKECIDAACHEGRVWMVDRSIHRTEHLHAIEAARSRGR